MAVIVLDCGGVLMDSTPPLIKVCTDWVEKFFNVKIEKEKAEEMIFNFSGGTFNEGFIKALESLFPGGYDKEIVKRGSKELFEKRRKIYKEAESFPEVIETLEQLVRHFHLVISSGLEGIYLEEWLTRIGIINLFEEICSGENGDKEKHLQMLRKKYPQPQEKIVVVADSSYEMRLGDISIGVARQPWQRKLLIQAGATEVISSLDKLLTDKPLADKLLAL